MAHLAITTNLNDTVTAALHEVDPTISVSTASSCLVYGTATGSRIDYLYERRGAVVRPVDPATPAYIIDFRQAYPDVKYERFYDTTCGEYTAQLVVFPLREVAGITNSLRPVALRAAKEVIR
jgi:hypothetical protein